MPGIRIRAGLLFTALLVSACSPEFLEPEPVRVLLIGDSITSGISSQPAGPSYAERLAELLPEEYEIINLGVNGASSLDLIRPGYLARISSSAPIDIATILLGTNDALGSFEWEPVAPKQYEAALLELSEHLVALGARVILMAPPRAGGPRERKRLSVYRTVVRSICESNPLTHCGPDLFTSMDSENHFEHGNVHPNGIGHERIAHALALSIRTVMEGD